MKRAAGFLFFISATAFLSAESSGPNKGAPVLSVVRSADTIAITSEGGPVTYTAIVDRRLGGDITEVRIPSAGGVIARELNDLFFYGVHGEEYTLRGWAGKNRFVLSCSMEVVSTNRAEVVIQVDLVATGTFKVVATDEALKARLRKALVGYRDKTVEVKRTYRFKPDRVEMRDEVVWVYPNTEIKSIYMTAAFMPGCIQGPARLVKGSLTSSFDVTSSGGEKLPKGIAYPFIAENFLKNGYEVTMATTEASFDLGKSSRYFYEKPWQQDWYQLSGFIYDLSGYPRGKPATMTEEAVFSRTGVLQGPPVVTIRSPASNARWMDEKGEVPKYRIGDVLKLSAVASNADGSQIPGKDISWEIHIDPWWNTPPVTLSGAELSYTLPAAANEEDRVKSQGRSLLAVIKVKAIGKNGSEAIEPFAMLVGR